jgi:hypothetical protein
LVNLANNNFHFNTESVGSGVEEKTEAIINFERVFKISFIANPN